MEACLWFVWTDPLMNTTQCWHNKRYISLRVLQFDRSRGCKWVGTLCIKTTLLTKNRWSENVTFRFFLFLILYFLQWITHVCSHWVFGPNLHVYSCTVCIIAGDSLYNLWPETNWTTVRYSISSSCAYSSWCRVISLLLVKVCLKRVFLGFFLIVLYREETFHDEHVVTVSTLESLCKSLSSVGQTAKLRYITSVQNSVFLEEYSKQDISFTCQYKIYLK